MRKIYFKLIALSLMLVLSVTMVASVSYAWLIMSTSPEVAGLQVTIGAKNTILVAADLTEVVDGVTYHYPDVFDDRLHFGQHDSYAFLQEVESLMPVSTADGIHWFLPEYYDATDELVQSGKTVAGQIKDISQFSYETDLAHANLKNAAEEDLIEGSYVYLDFWVVSPGSNCTLRISVPTVDGDNSGGSFLLEQPKPEKQNGSYRLNLTGTQAAAMFRVGFLANTNMLVDNSMVHYVASPGYNEDYRCLRGCYAEPGYYQMDDESNHFSIYEPNADYHPGLAGKEGQYLTTYAVGLVDDVPTKISVKDSTMVQKKSSWTTLDNGQLMLEQILQSAVTGKDLEDAELADYFYNTYLQGQVEHFVEKGRFIRQSYFLTDTMDLTGTLGTGATDDVYIVKLEKNIPQRIRMFVWLEGQDADCTNLTEGTTMMLNLEFAGSTVDETAGVE